MLLLLLLTCSGLVLAQKGAGTTSTIEGEAPLDTLNVDFNNRYALVIGNEDYPGNTLKNPVNDAKAIKTLLTKYGFKVISAMDLTWEAMDSLIRDFSDTIRANRAVGLFYFSGHGLQYNAENYLMPVNANLLSDEKGITEKSTRLNTILSKMAFSRKGMNIIILDACRSNPFTNSIKSILPGLSYSLKKTRNTLIFFATSANEVAEDGTGKNSPFTEGIVNTISQTDSIELMQIVRKVVKQVEEKTNERQVPQYVGTLSEDFYFKKTKQESQKTFVLSIGISKYKEYRNLPFASQGAIEFAHVFQGLKSENISRENVLLYVDNEATRYNILSGLDHIRRNAKPGDLILVFYSGAIVYNSVLKTILLPTTESALQATDCLTQADMLRILSDMPCKTLLFLDGYASNDEEGVNAFIDELGKPKNAVVVFTAGVYSTAIDDGYKNSPFAHLIINGLREGINPERGLVDILSLSNYLKNSFIKGFHPMVYFPKGWQNFTLPKLN